MRDAAGQPTNLLGQAMGATIEVRVNHDEGTLSYIINDGPPLLALRGFPRGAALRPWAELMSTDDRVSFAPAHVSMA